MVGVTLAPPPAYLILTLDTTAPALTVHAATRVEEDDLLRIEIETDADSVEILADGVRLGTEIVDGHAQAEIEAVHLLSPATLKVVARDDLGNATEHQQQIAVVRRQGRRRRLVARTRPVHVIRTTHLPLHRLTASTEETHV